MVFSRLLANDGTVGVDIGTSCIKIMHAEPSRQGFPITRVTTCPSPPDSVKEGIVVDVPAVASSIQFAMRSAGIKASTANAAIAGPGVLVRHVQIPIMSEQMLRKSIHFEAGKFIASSIEDSVVEFEIISDSEEPGQMKVMLVAAPAAMIESRVQTLVEAGLEPISIDVEAFATFRSLIEYNPDRSLLEGTVALLDIGANHAEINLVHKGLLMLTRTIPIAGSSLTSAIKNAQGLSDEEAEQKKYEIDLTELVDSPAGTTSDPALKAVQSLTDELLREIRRSISYFQTQLPDTSADANVDRVLVCGGSSKLRGLVPYTQSRLSIETVVGNPSMADYISPSTALGFDPEDLPLYPVAFGLSVKDVPAAARRRAA